MRNKLLFYAAFVVAMIIPYNSMAVDYDFATTVPSGQTLYFKFASGGGVIVTFPYASGNNYYYGYPYDIPRYRPTDYSRYRRI